jgi:RNA polymerase sigma factor for flagellar operon FliA
MKPIVAQAPGEYAMPDMQRVESVSTEKLPEAERQRLIVIHYEQVKRIASQMIRKLPTNIDIDDLIGWGTLGLMDALDRFSSLHGTPFHAYAEIRIRGAMVDGLRAYGVPRAVMSRARLLDNTRQTLTRQLGRPPEAKEMAEALQMDLADYEAFCDEAVIRSVVSGDSPIGEEGNTTYFDMLTDKDAQSPDEDVIQSELMDLAVKWIERLPPKEQFVVTQYFLKGKKLSEIGEEFGVTESRISQILHSAITRLLKYAGRSKPVKGILL